MTQLSHESEAVRQRKLKQKQKLQQQKQKLMNESSVSNGGSSSTVILSQRRKNNKRIYVDSDRTAQDAPNAEDVIALGNGIWFLLGACLLLYTGYWFAWYIRQLHENNMWFTNIKEVEREISLRTECGLYYSYYKQMILSPSLSEGFRALRFDNATEHGRTVNILQRFNVYQEVLLAALYRWLYIAKDSAVAVMQPMFFYVYSIFYLNGIYIALLYALTWRLTGSWMGGFLTALLFVVNLEDATRVHFNINLRECFALPFFAAQIFAISVYLERDRSDMATLNSSNKLNDILAQICICLFSFLFALMWQFNQFVLLLQAITLYVLALLQLAPWWKLCRILALVAVAMLGVYFAQFGQSMIIGSVVLSYLPITIWMIYLCRSVALTGGILDGSFRVFLQFAIGFVLALAFNFLLKKLFAVDSDEHIFKFLKGKFGFGNPLDFETRIYLCHGAFAFLDNEFFLRTTRQSLLFPLYFCTTLGLLFVVGKNVLMEWCVPGVFETLPGGEIPNKRKKKLAEKSGHLLLPPLNPADYSNKPFFLNQRPNLAFLAIESVSCGIMALMTLRMKYLWMPHMVVLAGTGLMDAEIWECLLEMFRIRRKWINVVLRHALLFSLVGYVMWQCVPKVQEQLQDLREFWDPDTVELMYWIGNNTDADASFGGSMQLMAGVKCCTGRHLMNHPHFEDKWLRDRTRQIYQIYARRSPRDVHKLLTELKADFVVLEDSICLARSDNCRIPDLIDIDNGHVPDNGFQSASLRKVDTPRFCDQIRHKEPEYAKYFKIVLENRTFRVYQVLNITSIA